jgi:hypothetical protein
VGLRAGLDDLGKIVHHTGTRTPLLGRPGRSQSLYRLSYPGPYMALANVSSTIQDRSKSSYLPIARIPHASYVWSLGDFYGS